MDRPILFSAPMVCAILAGTKTQTRRVIKTPWNLVLDKTPSEAELISKRCKHGLTGDRLWVRETWAEVGTCDPGLIVYRADYPACIPKQYENVPPAGEITWKPSIHMFRRHSRITLEIVSVRVERLQDISEEDAIAEGAEGWAGKETPWKGVCAPALVHGYATLWESINGAGSWEANPWVWVIEFKKEEVK